MGKIDECGAFDWKTIEFKDLGEHEEIIERIASKKITGVLIENVFSQDEVATMLQGLAENVPSQKKVFRDEVTIYPRGFAAYLDNQISDIHDDLQVYFRHGAEYVELFNDNIGVDFHTMLKSIFDGLSSRCSYKHLSALEGNGIFVPSQFRAFHPNTKALPVHNGNVFQKMYLDFYKALSEEVVVKNQMSYFLMLQKPDTGGELVLYDVPWKSEQEMLPPRSIRTENGEDWNIVDDPTVNRTVVDPSPGDMIIFMGGDIWHSVNRFEGAQDRVTLGGFFSFTKDNKHIVSWA